MNYDTAVQVYEAMKNGDAHLRLQVLRTAIRYSSIRAEWHFMTIEQRLAADSQRTVAHDAFIDAVNAISRAMSKTEHGNEWRRLLTDDRKIIGDFACLLVAHLGILAR
jgi:hypothetical protein